MTSLTGDTGRFPITFDSWYRVLSTVLGLPPSSAYLQVTEEQVEVRMGWAFRSRFRRSAVASAAPLHIRPLSRGVHGFGGSWLLNGTGRGILKIELSPAQRAYVVSVPISLRELLVSVSEVSDLAAILTSQSAVPDASMPPNNAVQLTKPAQAMELRS
jgi:hypothetical protein